MIMEITTLEQMESIVNKSKVLSWDGWDVVEMYPSERGSSSKFGAYKNGKWHLKKVFTPTSTGWNIPDKHVR
jgi:hypothetical protein